MSLDDVINVESEQLRLQLFGECNLIQSFRHIRNAGRKHSDSRRWTVKRFHLIPFEIRRLHLCVYICPIAVAYSVYHHLGPVLSAGDVRVKLFRQVIDRVYCDKVRCYLNCVRDDGFSFCRNAVAASLDGAYRRQASDQFSKWGRTQSRSVTECGYFLKGCTIPVDMFLDFLPLCSTEDRTTEILRIRFCKVDGSVEMCLHRCNARICHHNEAE